ncbi:uncharacterized protein LOC129571097, partial [Sitodiplosis mosellana]|uniref:uncharacterized protein LOC129571097 n=1 Tax=Sitodiplosis mosellana TaxID=263140 RepID=UPI0024438D9D
SDIEITSIPAPFAGIGFATIWDDCTQSLYYVDYISTGQNLSIFRYGFNEDRGYGAYIVGVITSPSFILPIKDCNKYKHLFAIGVDHDVIIVEWDGKSPAAKVSTLFSVEQFDQNSRWCLAKQSKRGHFYGGSNHVTFCNSPKNASLYMYTPEKGVTRLFGGMISTTGLAYDHDHLYHVDACTNLITAFHATTCGDI